MSKSIGTLSVIKKKKVLMKVWPIRSSPVTVTNVLCNDQFCVTILFISRWSYRKVKWRTVRVRYSWKKNPLDINRRVNKNGTKLFSNLKSGTSFQNLPGVWDLNTWYLSRGNSDLGLSVDKNKISFLFPLFSCSSTIYPKTYK